MEDGDSVCSVVWYFVSRLLKAKSSILLQYIFYFPADFFIFTKKNPHKTQNE